MLKVWMVIVFMGSTNAQVVGPLPYDVTECHERIVDVQAQIDQTLKDNPDNPELIFRGHQLAVGDVVAKCVESNDQPSVGDQD